ncbi:hypothetical protein, conserved [Eimeria necatrix]|uniref:Uncharacterized protein n=1 Tax=Eimeria necatrix TaxID=51315 RepID=U6N0C6_9EIME|nr:hypothetical protein, conserved [Eimeria necatrix]CDJ68194.1 hypothetical protein, conserved [Eimeria necatrix]
MGQFWGKSAKYSHEEKPVKKWYTDSALTLLTGCLSFITFLLNATACYGGNLRHLAPYDLNADFCGSKLVGEDRQYLYYPDPHNPTSGICVDSCPTAETRGTINIPDGLGGIQVHPITSSELVSGQYCFQRRLKSREILTTLQQQRPFLYSIVQDIFKATEVLFATIFLSIVLAIAGIKAMLNKRAGKNVCLAASFAPCFFSLLTVLLTLYHFFTPRVLQPGFSLLLLSGILATMSFLTGTLPVIFPKTYGRSRQFMLIGAQALEEMPDLLTFIIVTVAGIGVTVVWNIWICASLLTMGRAVPQPLVVDSHGETYMGIVASFTRTPGQGLACLVVLVTFVLQFESAIVFTKFLTTRCVKKWFEKLPRNGVRSPRCDYVLPVCMDVPKDWGPMGAAILFNNQLLPVKLDEANGGFLEAALAGYIVSFNTCQEFKNKKRNASAGAHARESGRSLPGSPLSHPGVAESIFVAVLTWIGLELAPIFNNTGEKALDSIPVIVLLVFVMSALVLTVFQEAVNAAACAGVMYWSKAASDVLWCNSINSDTLPVYESKHLRKFLELLRRKCDRQILF